jgi:hypothetical protein
MLAHALPVPEAPQIDSEILQKHSAHAKYHLESISHKSK